MAFREPSYQQLQANLRYELKMNDMALIPAEKQNLTECMQNILGLQNGRLVEIICSNIQTQTNNNSLPSKLEEIRDNLSLLEDYRKYPNLVQFEKITLEMLSHLHQTKITVYSIDSSGMLSGIIINQKGYQPNLKIARVSLSFYEVKDCSYSHRSSGVSFSVKSNNSSKLFEVFGQSQKKITITKLEIPKTLPHIPLIVKSMSNIENPTSILPPLQPPGLIHKKSLDQLPMQNYHQIDQDNPHQQTGVMDDYQSNSNMYYYSNQYQQPLYYQQPYMYNNINNGNNINNNINTSINKSQGYITSAYNGLNNMPMSPSKLSSSRRQNPTNMNSTNNSRLMQIDQNQRYTGRLKFFDDAKNYGFIIMEADESDIFVHCDDLQKAGINKERVKCYKQSEGMIRFSFKVMSYVGRYKESRKAVDLIIIDDGLDTTQAAYQ